MIQSTNKHSRSAGQSAVRRAALIVAALLGLLPIAARSQCANWDARGEHIIFQKNDSLSFVLNIEQNGRVLTGTAKYDAKTGKSGLLGQFDERTSVVGTVDGTLVGDAFSIQIFWPENLTGVYNGKILPSGRLDGETYDKNNSKIRQTWRSEGVLKCLPPAAPAAPPTPLRPPPIRRTGRAPKPAAVEPEPLKPPAIVATRPVFPVPFQPTGFVVLTWDGGADHPYAEVWVSVNGGEQTFVVEQGKGTRQIPIERGKAYEYVLTDNGKTLATVSFSIPTM